MVLIICSTEFPLYLREFKVSALEDFNATKHLLDQVLSNFCYSRARNGKHSLVFYKIFLTESHSKNWDCSVRGVENSNMTKHPPEQVFWYSHTRKHWLTFRSQIRRIVAFSFRCSNLLINFLQILAGPMRQFKSPKSNNGQYFRKPIHSRQNRWFKLYLQTSYGTLITNQLYRFKVFVEVIKKKHENFEKLF